MNTKSSFIFAVDQKVAKVEILNEYDGRSIVQNILQPPFA